MDNADSSRPDEVVLDLGSSRYVRITGIRRAAREDGAPGLFPDEIDNELRLIRQIGVRETEELTLLRRWSFWSTQIAMFAGLGFIVAAIASAILIPGLASKITAASISGTGAAITLYLRSTQMAYSKSMLQHISATERFINDRENTRSYRQLIAQAIKGNDPKVAGILIKTIPLFAKSED